MKIGQAIKYRREELNYSLDYLANRIGKSVPTLYRYERSESPDTLSLYTFIDICKVLKTTPDEVLIDVDDYVRSCTKVFPSVARVPLFDDDKMAISKKGDTTEYIPYENGYDVPDEKIVAYKIDDSNKFSDFFDKNDIIFISEIDNFQDNKRYVFLNETINKFLIIKARLLEKGNYLFINEDNKIVEIQDLKLIGKLLQIRKG